MKPQLAGHSMQFSLQGANSVGCFSHAFANSNSLPTMDLSQALKEDRKQIQKEIAMRRNKHMSSKKKATDEDARSSVRQVIFPTVDRDQKSEFIMTSARSNPSMSSKIRRDGMGVIQDSLDQEPLLGRVPGRIRLGDECGTVKPDSSYISVSIGSRSPVERRVVSTLTDRNALNDLCTVYSRVIRGTCSRPSRILSTCDVTKPCSDV